MKHPAADIGVKSTTVIFSYNTVEADLIGPVSQFKTNRYNFEAWYNKNLLPQPLTMASYLLFF